MRPSVREYISKGEERGVHRGYKCGLRKRWYIVPSQWVPDAFAFRQVHNYPRIVVNAAGATATDTLHRVRLSNGVPANRIATAFLNSLTMAFAEVTGRSYGGGVLTFEPSEIEQLPLPLLGAERLDPAASDELVRRGSMAEAFAENDRVLLMEGLGLTRRDIGLLRSACASLRSRRHARRVRGPRAPNLVPSGG